MLNKGGFWPRTVEDRVSGPSGISEGLRNFSGQGAEPPGSPSSCGADAASRGCATACRHCVTRCRHQRDTRNAWAGVRAARAGLRSQPRCPVKGEWALRSGTHVVGRPRHGLVRRETHGAVPDLLETQRAVFAAAGRTVMQVEIDARWSHAPVRRPGGRLSACRVMSHGLVGADEIRAGRADSRRASSTACSSPSSEAPWRSRSMKGLLNVDGHRRHGARNRNRARVLHVCVCTRLGLHDRRPACLCELPRHERAIRRLDQKQPPLRRRVQRLSRAGRRGRQVCDEGQQRLLALVPLHVRHVPEPIRALPTSRAIAETNCRRCHEPVVQAMGMPAHAGSREISCIRCHGSVGHMELSATNVADPSR